MDTQYRLDGGDLMSIVAHIAHTSIGELVLSIRTQHNNDIRAYFLCVLDKLHLTQALKRKVSAESKHRHRPQIQTQKANQGRQNVSRQ